MDTYGKEVLKIRYEKDLKIVYMKMLQKEKNKLEKLNEEWRELKMEMLSSIAHYDVATTGGVDRDLNTLSVEIVASIERFRALDQDTQRKKKEKNIMSNIAALERLLKQ